MLEIEIMSPEFLALIKSWEEEGVVIKEKDEKVD